MISWSTLPPYPQAPSLNSVQPRIHRSPRLWVTACASRTLAVADAPGATLAHHEEVQSLRRVMGWLRKAAIDSVNVDLISRLPAQTRKRFHTTLAPVSERRPDRLSLFSFADLPAQLPSRGKIDASPPPSRLQRIALHEGALRAVPRSGGSWPLWRPMGWCGRARSTA